MRLQTTNVLNIEGRSFSLTFSQNGKKVKPEELSPEILANIKKVAKKTITEQSIELSNISRLIFRGEKTARSIKFKSLTLYDENNSELYNIPLKQKFYDSLNTGLAKSFNSDSAMNDISFPPVTYPSAMSVTYPSSPERALLPIPLLPTPASPPLEQVQPKTLLTQPMQELNLLPNSLESLPTADSI